MKIIAILLLLGISLSYNPEDAVSYAKTYCYKYNPSYNNYKGNYGDGANFVSQCMFMLDKVLIDVLEKMIKV